MTSALLGEAGVLGVGDLVQKMPGDDHGHHQGLARSGRHLGAHAPERYRRQTVCSTPTFSATGASASQISVSTASSWQKKNRRLANSSGSVQ